MSKVYSRAYLLTKVLTASNREVVLYLYEGALSLTARAIEARNDGETAEAGESIERIIAILIELSTCLDYNQSGQLALRLDSIYNYLIESLTLSNKGNDIEPLVACQSVLIILSDAWRQAIEMDKRVEEDIPVHQLEMSA